MMNESFNEVLIWTGVIVVNKKCFNEVLGFNPKFSRGEGLDMWMRLAKKYNVIKSTSVTATYNLDVPESLTKSKSVLEKSILSIIDLRGKKGFERKYFKRVIYHRIKYNIKNFDIKKYN